ncbi:class I SAM-dependent methyltransferase [Tenacibaculum agarivorans]|uniref:class I SAM-dependent methyltransferase n=1 Tax=Tenacibaculum agarivorans TaxID=1908389 RepID=UPI00094BB369|nr:methyltransferase [Tenacibaculum agarivorans]
METNFEFDNGTYNLVRYPKTEDGSLRAWSNAELLVLEYIKDKSFDQAHLFNDRFGVWNCTLHTKKLATVWTYASQKKAVNQNLLLNNLEEKGVFKTPLDDLEHVELALLKIPKSLELFELFLHQITKSASETTEVVCGFMTKYFSPSYLKIAEQYFEDVSQSKAWKKARLLILKSPKKRQEKEFLNSISWRGRDLKQYYGVFSSGHIDIGTQFLLEHISIHPEEQLVLDLASGNGIIASEVLKFNTESEVTLIDDFNLAVESSKLNLDNARAHFFCNDTLENLPKTYFNLVVSNPPFHFEHENNIEVSTRLFVEVKECLTTNGRFVLVANKHLNYKTHLLKIFKQVSILKENTKFIIYECS